MRVAIFGATGMVGKGGLLECLDDPRVEHLRLVLSQLQVATVSAFVGLSLQHDFENWSLKPTAAQEAGLTPLFDQLESWSGALATVRAEGDADVSEDAAA